MDHEGPPDGSKILQGILDDFLNGLGAVLRVERAAAFIFDENGSDCRATAVHGLTGAERQVLNDWLTGSVEGRAYRERFATQARPIYVSSAVPSMESGPNAQTGTFAPHLAVPLIGTGDAWHGMIWLEMALPSREHIDMVAAMGRAVTIAIEQMLAAEARTTELTRLTSVLEIVREVDQRLDLPDVLAAICRKTVEAFGCMSATVFFYSRHRRASLPLADYGTPPHVAARFLGSHYIAGNIPHEHEVAAGRTIVISRGRDPSPEDVALLDLSENDELVLIPLRADDGTIRGVLRLGVAGQREFTIEELHALEVVAHHAATAIMRAHFLRATEETARFRAAVSALAVELNATSSRAQTLHVLCSRGCEIFGVGVALFLLPAGDRLVVTGSHGELSGAARVDIGLQATESPAVRAFLNGEVVLENDLRGGGEPLAGLRSILAIPLAGTEGGAGVLVLGDPRPRRFRPSVVEEAPVLGALAGAVLRNLELLGQLHESNQQLQRVSMVKDQFLATVSHDLRTPLSVVIGYAQLALEDTFGALGAEIRDVVERMLESANQQLNLVQDLLDLSRIELNSLTVKVTRVPLAPVFEEMEFLTTSLVRRKPVHVSIDPVAPELCVEADPHRLKQVLTNLLSNAAKFTDGGTIALRAIPGARLVCIEVSDTGVGIPPGEREAIFEPFRQVDGDRAVLGAGLGLAIARRLAELMGGTVTVDSTLGRGSTFRVNVPAWNPTDVAQHS